MSVPLTAYWALLATRLQAQRYRVFALAVLLLSSIGLQLITPQVLRSFIDGVQSGASLHALLQLALLFLGVALLKYGLTLGANYFSQLVSWTATNALRADLVRHVLQLDMSFHNQHTPGELIERVDGDVSGLADFFSELVIRALGSCLLLAGVLVALFLENWRVGIAFTLFASLALAVIYTMRDIATPHLQAERVASAELFGFIEERLAGTEDIRANGGTAYTMRGLFQRMRDLWQHDMTAYLRIANLRTTILTLFSVGTLLSLIMGAYLFWDDAITIGTVYLIYAYVQMLREPVEGLALEAQNLQQAAASILRINALTNTQSLLPESTTTGERLTDGALAVTFEKLSFAYPAGKDVPTEEQSGKQPNSRWALRDLSFHLSPGTVLGLVGRTGSGKSTIVRLLLRLYDPTIGAITLNGHELRDLPAADLPRTIGVVTQDVQLFHATLRDNLTFFDPTVDDAQIILMIEELGLTTWFERLSAGLDTVLDAGGAGLSAGEAQLVALIRVFLRNPGLVILDEASSRLDPTTERLLERALARLLKGRTGIIIAHRLTTVRRADQILVLDGGEMAEWGEEQTLATDPTSRYATMLRVGLTDSQAIATKPE